MIDRYDFLEKINSIEACPLGFEFASKKLMREGWTVERLIRHCRSGSGIERGYFIWLASSLVELNYCAFSGDKYGRLRVNSRFAGKLLMSSLLKASNERFVSYVDRYLMNAEIVS